MFAGVYKIVEQLFSKKSTNFFPGKYKPRSVTDFVARGKLHDPVPVPEDYRGRLYYDYDKCTGCRLCAKVCPAKAIELYPVIEKEKRTQRIVIFLSRCTFCSECVKVCPVNAITMSKEFAMADYEVYGKSMVVGQEERENNEIEEEETM